MQNAMVKSDFRATATHFVNIFVFLYFLFFHRKNFGLGEVLHRSFIGPLKKGTKCNKNWENRKTTNYHNWSKMRVLTKTDVTMRRASKNCAECNGST